MKRQLLLTFTCGVALLATLTHPATAQSLLVLDCDAGTAPGSTAVWDCATQRGGTATVSIIAAPSTLNPITANDTASKVVQDPALGVLFSGHAQLSRGALGNVPQIAKVIEVSEDGTTVTFTVRDGVSFSDGSAAALDDLLYWFHDVAFNPNLPNSFTSLWSCADGVPFDLDASGNTLTVSCAAPHRTFAGAAGTLSFISRQMALDLIDAQGIATEAGVVDDRATAEFMGLGVDISLLRGVGPFVLTQLVSDQVAVYARNPNFHGVDSNGTQLPYLDGHTLLILPTNGQNLALSAFLSGQTEALDPRPADIAPILGQAAGGGFSVNGDVDNATPSAGQILVTLNYDDQDTNLGAAARNATVRRALSLAVDRVAAVNNVLLGIGTPQYGPVSLSGNGTSYFIGRNNTCDTFIGAGLATADSCHNGVWTSGEGLTVQVAALPHPNASPDFFEHLSCLNDYDACVAQANALLDSVGIVDTDGDGIRDVPAGFDPVLNNPGGPFTVQVTTNSGNTIREAYTQIICDGWGQIGIDCSVNATAFSTLVTQLQGLTGATWTGGIVTGLTGGDPANGVNVLQCGAALYFWHLSCDPGEFSGTAAQLPEDAAVEAGFDAGFSATNVPDAQAGFDQMQIAFSQSLFYIPIAVQNALFVVRTDRLCNDSRSVRGNLEVKFRVDVGANASACSTNVGRLGFGQPVSRRAHALRAGASDSGGVSLSYFKDYGDGF